MRKTVLLPLICAVVLSACTSVDAYTGEEKVNNKTKGAVVGSIIGGAVGGIAKGKDGAITGAVVGGLAGLGYGAYLDKQEAELRQELQGTGVQVVRVGENLQLILPGNITFDSSSSEVKHDFREVLTSIVKVCKKYKKTNLQIVGHTDSTGSYDYNMKLSRQRANSVKDYSVLKGLSSNRVITIGKGPNEPISSNSTPKGREKNRRVEISFLPIAGEEY